MNSHPLEVLPQWTDFTDYFRPTVHRLSLLFGFIFCFSFFHFQFAKSFSFSVIFSSLLLSTPIYPIIALFLGESARSSLLGAGLTWSHPRKTGWLNKNHVKG